jgi:hypothetical protein
VSLELWASARPSTSGLLDDQHGVANEERGGHLLGYGQFDGEQQCEPFRLIIVAAANIVAKVGPSAVDNGDFYRPGIGPAATVEKEDRPSFHSSAYLDRRRRQRVPKTTIARGVTDHWRSTWTADYCRIRSVAPNMRGSLGVPTMRPLLPA